MRLNAHACSQNMESLVLCFLLILSYFGAQGQVISEPDDVTVCEGRSTSFTCVLDRSISKDDVQWYRLLKNTGTTERVNSRRRDMIIVPIPNENNFTTMLYINKTAKSQTGYYWVRLPSDVVCNVSLTVLTSPPALTVSITKNTESSSVAVQWDEVDDSLPTTYIVTWTSERDLNSVQVKTLIQQSSYTITGLTLDTVYTIIVTAINRCDTGPEYSTSVSLTRDTTSATSSITPNTTASTNPVMSTIDATTAASASMATAADVAMSSTITTDSTTSSTANIDITIVTTDVVISSIVSATTTVPSIISIPTTLVINTIASTTNTTTTAITATVAAATTKITTATTTTTTAVSPTSTARPADMTTADTTTADESSGGSIVYVIVGAIVGIIVVVLLLVVFCCIARSKSGIFNRDKFSHLKDNGTPDKNIPMVPNPLSTKDDDEKPDKLEVETSHQTSATLEGPVMSPDTESIKDCNINSQPLDSFDTYDKLRPPQPLDQCDTYDRLPSLIKDDDTCDKGDGVHNDKPPCIDANQRNDVDDPQKDTDGVPHSDIPVVTVPHDDDQTSDGTNQNKADPKLHYAVLDTLPPPTDSYTGKDNAVTAYAMVV